MSLSSRIEELQRKHDDLDRQVAEEQRRPGSSDFDISEMKKRNLEIWVAIGCISTP